MPRFVSLRALLTALAVTACGGGRDGAPPSPPAGGGQATAVGSDLTPFQLENGIGPITEAVTLGPLDPALTKTGETLFQTKCSACHKTDARYIGPDLGTVLSRRTPAFVMNMMMNPQEMWERHPVVKQLLAEYMTFMANQNVTPDEARAIVEYLRTKQSGS